MKPHEKSLKTAGLINFTLAFFQAVIGFFPEVSLYFGAPEILIKNYPLLVGTSLLVSSLLILFGLYALSGAGLIRPLPLLKPVLVGITSIYILRGLILIPEILVVWGILDTSIPGAQRFIWFSCGALALGLLHLVGIFRGWAKFPRRKS